MKTRIQDELAEDYVKAWPLAERDLEKNAIIDALRSNRSRTAKLYLKQIDAHASPNAG